MPCYLLMFDVVEVGELPEEFDRILGRAPRVAEFYEALSRIQWKLKSDGTYEDFRSNNVVVRRFVRRASKIWSPFIRNPEIVEPGYEWNRMMLSRALANGQYTELNCVAYLQMNGQVQTVPIADLDANELSRILMEDDYYVWTVNRNGTKVVAQARLENGDLFVYEVEPGYID
jgi:hypothetical protein